SFTKPIRPTNNEDEVLQPTIHLLLKKLRKPFRSKVLSLFIKQNQDISSRSSFQNFFPFGLFLKCFGKIFSILYIGNYLHFKRNIKTETLGVVIHQGLQLLVVSFANGEKCNFH